MSHPKTIIVDAIEGDKARLEIAVGQTHDLPLTEFPHGVKEGDVLREVDGKREVDEAETHKRHVEAQQQLEAVNRQADSFPHEIDL